MAESVKFDRAVEYYDATRGFPPGEEKPAGALVAHVGGFSASSRIIEIGVGTGRIALPVSPHVQGYYGIDISRPMMQKLIEKQHGELVFLTEGDATRLPFPDRSFDGAVAVHVFHLIPGWKEALNELGRVLRPNAHLVHCWTEDKGSFGSLWKAWYVANPKEDWRGGMNTERNPNFLEDERWRPLGEPQMHQYTVTRTLRQFLGLVKNRTWSSMWQTTDEEMARGLAAFEPIIAAEYPDPDAPIENEITFCARAYLPPQ